jgi:hypothetical protein
MFIVAIALTTFMTFQDPGVGSPVQTSTFTIAVDLANVRERPSTSSRIVNQLPRGAVVDVIGEERGWVEVVFQDRLNRNNRGFVSLSLGRLDRVKPASVPAREADKPVLPPKQESEPEPQPRSEPVAVPSPQQAPTPQIVVGATAPTAFAPEHRRLALGGRLGGFTFGVGGSLRGWTNDRFAIQFDISRYSIGSSSSFGGVSVGLDYSVMQFGPSVLYSFPLENQGDGVWVRPYAGGGLNVYRTTLKSRASGFGITDETAESETNLGFQVVGGAELRFRQVPRLGVSADLGYYSTGTPFLGIQIGGFAYGAAVHWYLR